MRHSGLPLRCWIRSAYQSEDARIRTAAFRVLRANANYLGALPGGWLWSLRGQVQYSPDALISGEQFGIGGAGSIRGTSERPITGDKGLLAQLELTTPVLAPGLRMVGFVEMGWLRNNNPNATNKPPSDQLAGAGLGLRYALGTLELSADWGRILNGSVLSGAANPTLPKTGDNKFHLNLTERF